MRLAHMLLLVTSTTALAAAAPIPECTVRVLRPITDDLGNHWKPDQLLPVTIARDTGHGLAFCASGGSCLPALSNGARAVTLTNCRIGSSLGQGDSRLDPDPALAGAATARAMRQRSRIDVKLSRLGFSNASAGTLADLYLSAPHSRTGRLVARALAGSTVAATTLKRTYP